MTGFDWDLDNAALKAFADGLAEAGARFPHLYADRPNAGFPSGLDLDGDGRTGGPRDALGYGRFAGHGGMALLSKLPIERDLARVFTGLRWMDFPGALLPETKAGPFPSLEALTAQPLSSVAHWDVPVVLSSGARLHMLAFAAGPPVFDGPEDRNGKRNHDEVAFWTRYLDGKLPQAPPEAQVVVLGHANLDPADGAGLRQAIHDLAGHPRLYDPLPASLGGAAAAARQGAANLSHTGDPGLDTADWRDDPGPGNLRVSYVLPDRRLDVADAGVFWPGPKDPLRLMIEGDGLPRHRLVWVDLVLHR